MPETIVAPTKERAQHDEIVVQPAGRKSTTQIYVPPFWETDRWKKILTEPQRRAATMFSEDHEQLNRGTKSCLASLDRIDHAGGPVLAETASEAQARIDAVRARLGPDAYSMVYCCLIYGMKPKNATGKHNQVAQGMVVMALEVMAQVYGLRS